MSDATSNRSGSTRETRGSTGETSDETGDPAVLAPLRRLLRRRVVRAPRPRRGTVILVETIPADTAGARLTPAGQALLREIECELAGDLPGSGARWERLLAVLADEDEEPPTDPDPDPAHAAHAAHAA